MKNTKTIAAAVVVLLVILAGVSLWMRSSQGNRVGIDQPATEMSGARKTSAIDVRAEGFHSMGIKMMVERKFPQAIEAFQQSLQIRDDPRVRFNLGRALLKAGRKDEAIQVFKQVAQGQGKVSSQAQEVLDELERNPNYGRA